MTPADGIGHDVSMTITKERAAAVAIGDTLFINGAALTVTKVYNAPKGRIEFRFENAEPVFIHWNTRIQRGR